MPTDDTDTPEREPEIEIEEYMLRVADQAGYARDDRKQALLGGIVVSALENLRRRALEARLPGAEPAEARRLKRLVEIRPEDLPRLDGPLHQEDLMRVHALLGSDPDLGQVRIPREPLDAWVTGWEAEQTARTGEVPASDPDHPSNATLLADLNAWVRAERPLVLVRLERAVHRAAPRFALDLPGMRALALVKVMLLLGESMPMFTERLVGFVAEHSGGEDAKA
jgi:hypothetical protein